MRRLLCFALLLCSIVVVLPSYSSATCTSNWTTIIESIQPQTALAGVTQVYVMGAGFGESQQGGSSTPPTGTSLTINGVAVPVATVGSPGITSWSDGEIVFTVPYTAASGDLSVTGCNGSDDSTNESDCNNYGECGNGEISATFTVDTSNPPLFYYSAGSPNCAGSQACTNVDGTPTPPRYVEGTWDEDDGYGDTAAYSLSQGTQNSDGTWPVTGSVYWSYYYGQDGTCTQSIAGTLDTQGNLTMNVSDDPVGGCSAYSEELAILNSGDMTSQGYLYLDDPQYQTAPPLSNFPSELGEISAEGDILFKAETDEPASETPTAVDWWIGPAGLGSQRRTYGRFERTLPTSSDGFVEFAGRFVFEQSGGQATDGCYYSLGGVDEVTSVVTGSGWYVDQNGKWGYDGTGIRSQAVDQYQLDYENGGRTLPCEITGPQDMYINTGSGPYEKYTANQLMPAEIQPTQLITGVQPEGGQWVTQCREYPGTQLTCD